MEALNERANNERSNKLFDAILKVAAEEAMKEEMDLMPNLDDLNKSYRPSASLNKKVYSIIKNERRAAKRKLTLRGFVKVAAVIGIFFTISTTILLGVEASRNFILNTFINIQNDHVAFEFNQSKESADNSSFIFNYFPQGFNLLNSHNAGETNLSIYTNDFGEEIIIQQSPADTVSTAIDNENRVFSPIILNGHEIFVFEALDAQDQNVVMRQIGNHVFIVQSHIETDELLKIITNIE